MQFQSNYHRRHESPSSIMYLPGMTGRINDTPLLNVRKPTSSTVNNLKVSSVSNVDKPKPTSISNIRAMEKKSSVPPVSPWSKIKKSVRIQDPSVLNKGMPAKRAVSTLPLPKSTPKTNAAAKHIQRIARGKIARTNTYIKRLEYKLASAEATKEAEIQAIQDAMADEKIAIRRKLTHKQAKTVKKQLACAETANEGSKLIQFLRQENMKLRKKNEKIAVSMYEMHEQNKRLEEATKLTLENHDILQSHFVKIQETHDALMSVVPKYEAKIAEMTDALDIRRQYCLSEHKMKVMYVKLVGTLGEMVEHHSKDKDLIDEVLGYCMEMEDEQQNKVGDDMKENAKNGDNGTDSTHDDTDYDEVSVHDDEDGEIRESSD